MSVRLNYENNSELIEHLPVTNSQMNPVDYAKIAPLLEEGSKTLYPLRKYIIIFILFVIFSLNSITKIITEFSPSIFKRYDYAILFIKSIVFVIFVFVLDNIIINK